MNQNIDNVDSVRSSEIKTIDNKDMKCAPSANFNSYSCIRLKLLVEMTKAFNMDNPHDVIKLYPNLELMNPTKYKRYLLKQIKDRLSSKCNSQKCWTEQDFINNMKENVKEELLKYTFRPDGPDGRFEWLNTINIDEVMSQYEIKYPDFIFKGAVPIDFDDLPMLGIKNLNFKKLIEQGKIKMGIIFNLDKHNQTGSHWVALYCNLQKGEIYFFDSYGIPPAPEIRELMRRITRFCESYLGEQIRSDYNKIRCQFKNSECGIYSINFLLRLLQGDRFEDICQDKTTDSEINKLRNVLFINSNFK